MYVDDPLVYVNPSWTPYDPRERSLVTVQDYLGVLLETYLHFFPAPRRAATRSLADINVCLGHLGLYAKSSKEAWYHFNAYAWNLLFDDDIEIAALYAALLLTDAEKAKSVKGIDKEKVLAFFGETTVLDVLQRLLLDKIALPALQEGFRYIKYSYWKDHCNIFEGDHQTVVTQLRALHETTHLSLSYLLEQAQISCTEILVLGFN